MGYEEGRKKYSIDGEFKEPVVRCDKCMRILLVEELRKRGDCKYCGSHRVRSLKSFTLEEKEKMEKWGVDEDFLALFKGEEE